MYITLEELKEYLQITDTSQDQILMGFIQQISSTIDGYLWYSLKESSHDEWYLVRKSGVIRTKAMPITEVTSLSFSSVKRISKNAIYLVDSPLEDQEVQIKYKAGHATIPAEIKQLCLDGCKQLYKDFTSGELDIKSKKIDTLSITYFSPEEHTEGNDVRKLNTFTSILKKYKTFIPHAI